MVMNDLWQNHATKDTLISILGEEYKKVENGIVYSFSGYDYARSGHFFDKFNKLTEQFVFLDKKEFEKFKEKIKCDWLVDEKVDSSSHAIKTIFHGKCEEQHLTYTYPSHFNSYEVRWK